MRRSLALIPCLAILASLPSASKADPIQANVTISVGQLTSTGSDATVVGGPYQYSGTIPDLGAPPSYINLSGPTLGAQSATFLNASAPRTINADATFNMTITLDGGSGSHPTIDVSGNLTGSVTATALSQSVQGITGFQSYIISAFQGTATSVSLQDWTPASGIPMSVIDSFLKPSTYSLSEWTDWVNSDTQKGIDLNLNPSAGTETPEPATVLLYFAVIAGLGVRRGARLWRSCSAR